MIHKIRELNQDGINRFLEYIEEAREGQNLSPPVEILDDDAYSQVIGDTVTVERRDFGLKREMAEYINGQLSRIPSERKQYNSGLWTWLSLFYFDLICPEDNGRRKVLKYWHYVLDAAPDNPNWQTYYRHMIASPCHIHILYPNSAHLILDQPVSVHGDYMEQFASRQEIISNRSLIEVADRLYFDFDACRAKRGIQTRTRPGNIRRLVYEIFQQLNLTYDMYSMSPDQIIELLPRPEFNQWIGEEAH